MTIANAVPEGDWRLRGLCRDEDPELFFPTGHSGPALLQIAEAKAVCRRCPVQAECLDKSIENRDEFGIFGGTDEEERKPMLRRVRGAWSSNGAPVDPNTPVCESGHPQTEDNVTPSGKCRVCGAISCANYRDRKKPVDRVACSWCRRRIAIRRGVITRHHDMSGMQCEGSFSLPQQAKAEVSA